VPVPPCSFLANSAGEIFFGSQIVHHSVSDNSVFFTRVAASSAQMTQISRITAFDLFVGNSDRHINNYLIREQDGRERVLRLISVIVYSDFGQL
jgi:hypothetical protein